MDYSNRRLSHRYHQRLSEPQLFLVRLFPELIVLLECHERRLGFRGGKIDEESGLRGKIMPIANCYLNLNTFSA